MWTRALVAVVTAGSLGGGCFYPGGRDHTAHRDAFVVDAVLIVGGAVAMIGVDRWCPYPGTSDLCPIPFLVFGGVGAGGGLLGAIVNSFMPGPDDEIAPGRVEPPRSEAERRRRALEVMARDAAREDNCAAVRAAVEDLRANDAARAAQLVTEPPIAACLH